VNITEAKQILLLYRPGTRDAQDPEVAAALQLVKEDAGLARWFEEHCASQNALRQKFRQLSVPAGLKEQIISERAVAAKRASRREKVVGVAAVAAIVIALAVLGVLFLPHNEKPRPVPNNLANYLGQMADSALQSYYMNVATNSAQIQSWLAKNQAPADYVLPVPLQKVALTGCAAENWQNSRAAMICFRMEKSLPPGQQSDLWLFVIDSSAVQGALSVTSAQFAQLHGLMTAAWTQDGKLYVLGMKGDEQTIQKFL
jgi:hypothetical protein